MRKLHLDFQRKPPAVRAGWLLLAAGLVVAGALARVQLQLSAERADAQLRLARVHGPGGAGALLASDKDDPAVAAARQVLARARLPWPTLFGALEAADPSDVALLAITPDVQRRQVKIEAEARDLASMLAFHRHLQGDASLANVVLADHTVVKDQPETPVRFHILASWGTNNHANP